MRTKQTILFFFALFFAINLSAQFSKREMRAVWIATVANIDWPSRMGLSSKEQKAEMIQLLNKCKENNINAIFVQIRPTADAFFPSTLEPWSHWLTGKQGVAPQPFYDPLEFIITEAHKRCIEVHAWLNPYRVVNSDDISLLDKNHLYFKKKELFVKYGGKYYFDPGLEETREFLVSVVKNIVEMYDIDAIHFDDYFYPYPVKGEEFPDEKTFKKYPRGFTQKDDWRRDNVNLVIKQLNETIKGIKPWVEFGISPFGVWRNADKDPRGSATQAGVSNYDDLYADILKWLEEGTIDYVVPQLYWEIGKKVADYSVLIDWWSKNSYGRNLYIGLYASLLGNSKVAAWNNGNELIRQLHLNKKYPQVKGAAYFSAKGFVKNPQGLNDSLRASFYKYPAIVPINRNLKGEPSTPPQNVHLFKDGTETVLIWDEIHEEYGCRIAYYIVYAFKGKEVGDLNNAENILAVTADNYLDFAMLKTKFKGYYTFVVTSVNRYKYESPTSYSVTKRF
jgi:uncharacterized lipoprotein YddW (UPF0748 family)